MDGAFFGEIRRDLILDFFSFWKAVGLEETPSPPKRLRFVPSSFLFKKQKKTFPFLFYFLDVVIVIRNEST